MRAWASATSALCSGIGSGSGVSGRPHSSVHGERSMRAGLPVSERDRTVSADDAARNFSFTTGSVSASSVVSHTDPHHTPSAPRARAAASCRPRAIPPAASTGMGATASTTSGTSTMVEISPVWPPASVPWATMMSAPALACRLACTGEPALVGTDVLLRQQEVDAERRTPRLLPDPGQVVVELVGRVGDGAEHAEASDPADGGHDVAAVAEGEDGEFDPEEVLDAGAH